MRTKIIFKLVAIMAIVSLAFTSCQNDALDSMEHGLKTRAVTSYTVNNVVGDYHGRLDKVIMNGKEKNPVEDRVITISRNENSGNKFNIYLPPFQIGSMPGTITIDAKGITLNADGTFTAENIPAAVILTMAGVPHKYVATLIDGRFTQISSGYKLEFGLDTEGFYLFGQPLFTAYVHFTGNK